MTGVQTCALPISGRTAILALSMFNTASQNDTSIDTRSRSYLFVRVSLAGSGASLSLDSEVLYGVDDVFSSTSSSSGGGYQELSFYGATEEIDREPIFDEHGVQIGDTVTYEYPSAVAVQDAPGGWRGPGSISSTVRWLVMVVFQGETPVPCYLNFEDGFSIGAASFSCSTDRAQIVEEFNDGTNRVSQPGISHLSGGGSSSGKSTISWQGPGDAWARSVSYGDRKSVV